MQFSGVGVTIFVTQLQKKETNFEIELLSQSINQSIDSSINREQWLLKYTVFVYKAHLRRNIPLTKPNTTILYDILDLKTRYTVWFYNQCRNGFRANFS